MKYSFDCHIKTPSNGIRNAVKQLIPDINDARVWDGEYAYGEAPDDDGIMSFDCKVRFNLKTDMESVTASVKGLAGVINACESGSFVKEIKTWHDENPDNPPYPCEVLSIVSKP